MNAQRTARRLAAIMAGDVVGYSALMGADEAGTLAALKAHRAELIDPQIAEHGGRIVKLMGDGMLVEFASVVDAVECAKAIQDGMAKRTATIPAGKRIDFRIGINLGDVVIDGNDLYGDGVNIAARLEGIAEPGGICISAEAQRQVAGKVRLQFDDMGEQMLKNIDRPVRAYRVVLDGAPAEHAAPAETVLPLPDKPSIAVLPFDSFSADPEQEYFADGIGEDLITDLSKISGLFVVARNSSAAFKGKKFDIRDAARRLGVRYVLEGSVRRAGDRVRVNAQLIEAATEGHLWADRYDGSAAEVFAFQDDVCAKIVAALSVTLSGDETDNLKALHTTNLDAYELYVRARATPYPPVPERIKSAAMMFAQVVEMDPDFAGGHAGVSAMISFGALWGHGGLRESAARALAKAQEAIAVDDNFAWSYTVRGMAQWQLGDYDEALVSMCEGVARAPGDADTHAFNGLILGMDGQYEPAFAEIRQAMRLNPLFFNGPYHNILGQSQMLAGRYEEGITTFTENVERGGPLGPPALCWGAAVYQALGRQEEAAKLVAWLTGRFPGFTIQNWNYPRMIRDAEVRNRVGRLMREAGVR